MHSTPKSFFLKSPLFSYRNKLDPHGLGLQHRHNGYSVLLCELAVAQNTCEDPYQAGHLGSWQRLAFPLLTLTPGCLRPESGARLLLLAQLQLRRCRANAEDRHYLADQPHQLLPSTTCPVPLYSAACRVLCLFEKDPAASLRSVSPCLDSSNLRTGPCLPRRKSFSSDAPIRQFLADTDSRLFWKLTPILTVWKALLNDV